IEALVRRGLVCKNIHIRPPTARPRHVNAVRLSMNLDDARKLVPSLVPADAASTVWQATSKYRERVPALPPPQARACVYLREHTDGVTSAELKTALGTTTATLRALEKNEWIVRTRQPNPSSPRAAHLNHIVEFLARENDSVWVSAVYAATDASLADLKKLEAAGIVALETTEFIRDPLAHKTFMPVSPPTLTPEQDAAWQEIKRALDDSLSSSFIPSDVSPKRLYILPSSFLLHGVTGSGKTEIYLDAIDHVLAQGKQAIALIPEISLTPQTLRRFGARFGNRLGVIHSQLSIGERYDTWRRIRDGKIDVVIGPRSALFAPLPRLGLVVLDEEHDASYKSDVEFPHSPAYHARQVALEMARTQNVVVILGSATPDVETYANAVGSQHAAQRGELKLLELPQRVIAHETERAPVRYQELPPVEIVDMRAELVQGNRSMFSRALRAALDETLVRGEQAILFLNRRGTAQAVVCRDCGHVVKCPRCNNPYTLHTFGDQTARELVCHHCGKHGAIPRHCPNCGSTRIRGLGVGTEKLEDAVRAEFPRARTLRWDRDVTQGKEAHAEILETFLRGEANVLIGTQMIAKGLDLPRVTLVGVVNADISLFLPDFRAAERTFQLLTQVAGRAGRSALGGRALLQTYNPEHYAIQTAARHAYHDFYQREIEFRRVAAYPPARPLTRLLFTGASVKIAREASETLARLLSDRIRRHGILDVEMIGPAPAFFAKLRGKYRQHILLKGKGARDLLALYPLPYGWRIDVDPLDLL
ncbi:MAG: primosomal protein N', partial [Chloroflexi bacterium]|nr:primosomal protein N' [Chloroflexota bacterium]